MPNRAIDLFLSGTRQILKIRILIQLVLTPEVLTPEEPNSGARTNVEYVNRWVLVRLLERI